MTYSRHAVARLAMCAAIGALAVFISVGHGTGAVPASADLDALEFLIGEWTHTGTIAPESFGDQAGPFAGPVICEWGAFRSWIVCDHWTEALADLGPYEVHVVIRVDSGGGGFVGHVVNPYGASTYEGELESPGRLVFTGGRSSPQRVIYEKLDNGNIRFAVEASSDGGATFLPHTDGLWERTAR